MRFDHGTANGATLTAELMRSFVTYLYEFNYIFVNPDGFNVDWCDSYWCRRAYWRGYYD
jgi:hypothetical protein